MDTISTGNQPIINLEARDVGDLTFDTPNKDYRIYTSNSFGESQTTATGTSDIQNIISPEEFARKMEEIANTKDNDGYEDFEVNHIMADDLMMKTLSNLGYSEGVQIFNNMKKRYS